MPFIEPRIYSTVHDTATALPMEFWAACFASPSHFNTILPIATKCRDQERAGHASNLDHVWILVWTSRYPEARLDMVIACTSTEMGAYPIFIASTAPTSHLSTCFLKPRLDLLCRALLQCVPVERVYSVFCPDAITNIFVPLWTEYTGVQSEMTPYYAAKLSVCTQDTLVNRSSTTLPGVEMDMRPAVPSDLEGVAELCYRFASESEPFVLTEAEAVQEAILLIQKKQVWVHTIRADGPTEIASLVACTRNSDAVATITKVYTNPRWRRRGCAERLVRRVCKTILATKYQKIALYVGHENPAAKVYHRVGFAGLGDDSEEGVNCENWTEIGFDRSVVVMGHW